MRSGTRHGMALLLIAAIGVTLWNFWHYASREDVPPIPFRVEPTPTGAPGAAPTALPSPSPAEVDLEVGDELVRRLAKGLSERPELAKWLAQEHLIRRFVVVVDRVAQGKGIPKQTIAFLEPAEDFATIERDGRIRVDPRTYRRYDAIAEVAASIEPEGTATLYRELEPHIEAAWAELGYPDRRFEQTLEQAIRNLLSVPVIEGEIELDPRVTTHEYADRRLEELSPARKHLLRMGPDNVRKIQTKLREIARALDLDVEDEEPDGTKTADERG